MRLTKIEFNGYKRLANTSCNVDGKLIAFLGPNESGKSTVLEGLAWLMSKQRKSTPLHNADLTRDFTPEHRRKHQVSATFTLSERDRDLLLDLYIDAPRSVTISRRADGLVNVGPESWYMETRSFVERLLGDLGEVMALVEPSQNATRADLELVAAISHLLQNSFSRPWLDKDRTLVTRLATMLCEPRWDGTSPAFNRAGKALELLTEDGVAEVVPRAILNLCPDFLLYGASDRLLRTSYDLADEDAASTAALQNLLRLGGTSVEQLKSLLEGGNLTLLHTALRRANNALREKLPPLWQQSKLTVELAAHGSVVQLLVHELGGDGATTSLDERSEGLRTFIALMAFLHDRPAANPPVLLIDEAETKLHLDAQADLMEVLQQQTVAGQILYTTHSLDCLPPDVGTGLRFVVPTSKHTSELRSNFWSSGKAGFRELHVMAGASRTAYSRFSRAVLTEGASEMLLLPTLIRKATGEVDLFYRVAPGLSNISADSLELYDPADRIVYLVDGDGGGEVKKKALVEAGMPADRVLSLPAGKAMEDLLTIDSYLRAVNDHIEDSGRTERISAADLAEGVTRSKAVGDWCKAKRIKAGKTAIASRLVGNPDQIELEPAGATALVELHAQLTEILKP